MQRRKAMKTVVSILKFVAGTTASLIIWLGKRLEGGK
jgi:hypothetical protein